MSRLAVLPPLLLLLLAATAPTLATTSSIAYSANLATAGLRPFPHYWEECVGSSHMALGLRADWQQALKKVKAACGFRRIRGHGLLDNDMDVILGPAAPVNGTGPSGWNPQGPGNHHFNWRSVDLVYDFLLSIDMKPVVALSWLPDELTDSCEPVWHYKGCHAYPNNLTVYGNLITSLAGHLVSRHGVEEIRQWPFELWNEPNCGPCLRSKSQSAISSSTTATNTTNTATASSNDSLFPACPPGTKRNPAYPKCPGEWSLSNYLNLFNTTSSALKAIDPLIPVGGPATEQLGWVQELKDFSDQAGVALDFISTHQYPSDPQVPATLEGHSAAIRSAAQMASPRPLYLTEYAVNNHDSINAAAGILTYIPRLSGALPLYSYWAFSDIFEESGIDAAAFHNEWGLLNVYGNPKPSFRAFEMLHEAGDRAAPIQLVSSSSSPSSSSSSSSFSSTTGGQDVFATAPLANGSDTAKATAFVTVRQGTGGLGRRQIHVFFVSYDMADGGDSDDPAPNEVEVSLSLVGLVDEEKKTTTTTTTTKKTTTTQVITNGTAARLRRIDNGPGNGNTRGFWRKQLKSTVMPTPGDIAGMEQASELAETFIALTVGEDGAVGMKLTMPRTGVAVVDFVA